MRLKDLKTGFVFIPFKMTDAIRKAIAEGKLIRV